MFKLATLLLGASVLAPLAGAKLDVDDRRKLLDHLKQSSREFLSSVKGLSPEQWNFKAGPDRWSIAECAEHIALSEGFLRELITGKVLATPATPDKAAERRLNDEKVIQQITDRSSKAKAPEPLTPNRKFSTPAAALAHFKESRKKTAALAKSRPDLRNHALKNPLGHELDAHQWLLVLSGHTMRHTAQINEVKAAAGFPK